LLSPDRLFGAGREKQAPAANPLTITGLSRVIDGDTQRGDVEQLFGAK
jgi:hypothetical protein